MTNGHSSLEKYTSHTLFEMVSKGLRKGYVWEVSWKLNKDCNILTPCSSGYSSTSFSSCGAAQSRALRSQLSAGTWFSLLELQQLTLNSDHQLTELVCRTGLYHCLTLICFLWASHLHSIQPVDSQGYTLISSTGCTCYLHSCISYSRARPGRRSICYTKSFVNYYIIVCKLLLLDKNSWYHITVPKYDSRKLNNCNFKKITGTYRISLEV